eukprot:GGOE01005166.1.p1 GENE.GGOE01005166.1~~GGOE01005166.1.p1  ORF type:complete len:269 (+),score=9.30 GGOE01005166.1:114-920(+)
MKQPLIRCLGEDDCVLEWNKGNISKINWTFVTLCTAAVAFICILFGQMSRQPLHLATVVPSLAQTTPHHRIVPIGAEEEGQGEEGPYEEDGEEEDPEVSPLADLFSNPEQEHNEDLEEPFEVLNFEMIDVPTTGQKRAIRRMAHLAFHRWRVSENDVGSAPVQIARLTARIDSLSKHIAAQGKDIVARRRIVQIASQRRSLLSYLWKRDPGMVVDLIQELKIRWRRPESNTLIPLSGPVKIRIPRNAKRPRTIPWSNQVAEAAAAGTQ